MLCCAESWKASACIFSECRVFVFNLPPLGEWWIPGINAMKIFAENMLFIFRSNATNESKTTIRRAVGPPIHIKAKSEAAAASPRRKGQWAMATKEKWLCLFHFLHFVPSMLSSFQRCWEWPRHDSNLQSPARWADALSIGPRGRCGFFCVIQIVITSLQNFSISFWVNMQWSEIEFGSCCTSHTHETTGSSGALTSSFHRRRTQVPLAQAARIQMPHVSIYLKMVWIRSSARRKRAWARNTCGRGGLTYYTGSN